MFKFTDTFAKKHPRITLWLWLIEALVFAVLFALMWGSTWIYFAVRGLLPRIGGTFGSVEAARIVSTFTDGWERSLARLKASAE